MTATPGFIGDNEILAVSPSGEVLKRIHFEKPYADLGTVGIYVSEDEAAVRLAKLYSDHRVETSFLLIDLSTAKILGWYAVSRKEGWYNDVGFTRSGGFALFASEKGMIKVARAQVR